MCIRDSAYPNLRYTDRPVRVRDMGEDELELLYDMVWRRASDEQWKGDRTLRAVWEMGRRVLIGHTITTYFCSARDVYKRQGLCRCG